MDVYGITYKYYATLFVILCLLTLQSHQSKPAMALALDAVPMELLPPMGSTMMVAPIMTLFHLVNVPNHHMAAVQMVSLRQKDRTAKAALLNHVS